MRRALAMSVFFFALVVMSGCSSARHHTPAATEENFGVRMAQQNLWREAMFRFQRAVEMNPQDAMAHNNLAVAYEANGEFDKASKEYREAMRLDKTNQYIQKNYSRFVEFTSRNKKRQQRHEPAAGVPATKTASTKADTPATTAAPPMTAAAPPPAVPTAEAPGPPPQPAGTAPAGVPPTTTDPPAPPPPPVKPPGD